MQVKKDTGRHLILAVKQFKVISMLLFRAGAITPDLGKQPTWGKGQILDQFCKLQKRFVLQSTSSTRTLQRADIDLNSKMRLHMR